MHKDNINSGYVKELRVILEGEVEEAEVIMAARNFSKELQDMIQKVGRLANEQVGPVVDQIRLTYGGEMAASFQNTVKGEMDSVLATLASAKDTLDDVVTDISNGTVPGSVDMDSGEFDGLGDELGDELGPDLGDEMDAEMEPEMGDAMGGEEEFEDEFGAEEPLGRNALESKRLSIAKKIIETKEKIKKINGSKEK
jgi:hypothetical protein